MVNPHDGELPPLPWDVAREGEDGCDDEEILILRELRHRKTVLDRRAVELEERITAAEVLEAQLAVKLSQLQVTRTEILVALHEQQRLQEVLAASGEALPGDADEGGTVLEADQAERVQSLARMVEAMKPRAAGPMLAGMDPDVALMVLQLLKPKQAGKVLAAMPAGVAQQLGDRMTARNPGASAAADRVESTPAPAEPAPQTGEEEGS